MPRPIVTFDAGSSLLKMAVFSAERNRIQLTDFDVSPLSIPAEASLEEKNRLLARQMKARLSLKKIKNNVISVSISGQSVFTRFVKLPAVEEAKVSQIIRYEAQQQVPFPIEDVEWDHNIIGKTASGEIDIVLVAAKNDVIGSFLQECKKAGLDVSVLDVAPLAIYNCLRHVERDFAECTAVVDFGAKAANLIISEGDDLWARTIPIGGENITAAIAKELNLDDADAEKLKEASWVPNTSAGEPENVTEEQRKASEIIGSFLNRMHAELSRSIGFYRSQPGHSAIRRILISGGSSRLKNFKAFLSDKFKVDVAALSPLERITIARSVDRAELNRCSDLLPGVVGLGLRGAGMGRIRINLLPKSIFRQKELARKKTLLVAAGWLIVATFLVMAAGKKLEHGDNSKMFGKVLSSISGVIPGIAPTEQTLKEQEQELQAFIDVDAAKAAEIKMIEGEIQKVEKKVDAITEMQNARLYWAEFIEELKRTKASAAGRGQRNVIWLIGLRITTNQAVASEFVPTMRDSLRGTYRLATSSTIGPSTRSTARRTTAADASRPWVIITAYVKIPPEASGETSSAIASARAGVFKNALEVMGEQFACTKEHRYREDKATGVLYPVSPDSGPAKAYRYRWDDAEKQLVLEGLVKAEPAEGEEAGSGDPWQVLANYKTRKPNWITEEGTLVGDEIICPISVANSQGKRTLKCNRTGGYLDDVQFSEFEMPLPGERVLRFSIVARLAEDFYYSKKSEML